MYMMRNMLEYFIRDDDSDDLFLQCLWVVDGSIVCCLGSSFIILRPYKTNIEYESRLAPPRVQSVPHSVEALNRPRCSVLFAH
mmetsp:Transcript_22091/g.37721  ORF Transcript_22091/g.37721 Transcript_22091/m.37721 type:complete len:83 (+) Transcript_22091:297-545(+)